MKGGEEEGEKIKEKKRIWINIDAGIRNSVKCIITMKIGKEKRGSTWIIMKDIGNYSWVLLRCVNMTMYIIIYQIWKAGLK